MTKECSKCHQSKELTSENFLPDNRYHGRFRHKCRECHYASTKEWKKNNPDKVRANNRDLRAKHPDRAKRYEQTSHRLRKYNLSPQDYERLLVRQNHLCALCLKPLKKPCVDHDHATGAVRGLLCYGCNIGLGQLGDSIQGLRRAMAYLQTAATSLAPFVCPPYSLSALLHISVNTNAR